MQLGFKIFQLFHSARKEKSFQFAPLLLILHQDVTGSPLLHWQHFTANREKKIPKQLSQFVSPVDNHARDN